MSMVFDPGDGNMLVVDGNLVERDALHIAEKINDYDERLFLICLDPDADHAITDAPFVVIRQRDDGLYDRVLEAWKLDDTIMERIWLSDNQKHDQLQRLINMELSAKKEKEDRQKALGREHAEIFASAMKNKKSTYTLENNQGDLVTINDAGPVTVNGNKKSYS